MCPLARPSGRVNAPAKGIEAACASDIEEDVEHIAIGDRVGLAFLADPAALLGGGLAAGFQQLIPADYLGSDEASRQVGMDGARGILCVGALDDRPRAALVLASGEEGDQSPA